MPRQRYSEKVFGGTGIEGLINKHVFSAHSFMRTLVGFGIVFLMYVFFGQPVEVYKLFHGLKCLPGAKEDSWYLMINKFIFELLEQNDVLIAQSQYMTHTWAKRSIVIVHKEIKKQIERFLLPFPYNFQAKHSL